MSRMNLLLALLAALSLPAAFAQEADSADLTDLADLADLIEELADDDAYVRKLAREGLLKRGKPVVAPLIMTLSSKNARVREQAAIVLGDMGEDAAAAVPALEKLLVDPEPTVRVAAKTSLIAIRGKIQPKPAEDFAGLAAGPRPPLLAALRGNDPLGAAAVVVPQLLRIMESRDDALKIAAGRAFSRFGKDARFATPKLIAMGRTAAWPQRFAVVDALAAIGPSVAKPLLEAWDSCRDWAPEVCFRLKEGVFTTAMPALADPDKAVRAAACDMLGAARCDVGVKKLAAMVHDRSGKVRRSAARALGGLGADVVSPLILLAADPERRAQREAVVALRRIVLDAAAVHRTPVRHIMDKERKAYRRGLAWLTAHQEETGAWDSERHGGAPQYTAGVTGIALLALLEGTPAPEHDASVEAGLRYLVAAQDREGCYGPRTSQHFLYNHASASLAMCVAFGQTKNPTYGASAQRALDFIAAARSQASGGWRYVPGGDDSDTSMTGWMVHALRRGLLAGLDVDAAGFAGTLAYLERATTKGGRIGYLIGIPESARPEPMKKRFPPDKTRAMTSSGAFALYQAGGAPSLTTVNHCLQFPPQWEPTSGQLDMYYWFHATRLAHHVGGGALGKWARSLKAALVEGQDEDGSWAPVGPWGPDGGRVYSTSLMVLCLKTLDGRLQPVRFKRPTAKALRPALSVLRSATQHGDEQISAAAKNALSALR